MRGRQETGSLAPRAGLGYCIQVIGVLHGQRVLEELEDDLAAPPSQVRI